MNSKIYNIIYNKVCMWLTPAIWANDFDIAWTKALTAPVRSLYQSFLRFKTEKEYRLLITPQVCYMERMLNDRYDNDQRRIRIENAKEFSAVPFYQEAEEKYVVFGQEDEDMAVVFYTDAEAGVHRVHFVILVPLDIVFDEKEMTAITNAYKKAGRKFKIQRV